MHLVRSKIHKLNNDPPECGSIWKWGRRRRDEFRRGHVGAGGAPCPREGRGAQTSGPRRWCQAELPGTVCCTRGRVPRPCRLPRRPREAGALAIPISQARRVRSRGQVTCLCSHDCPRVSDSAIPWSSHQAGVGGVTLHPLRPGSQPEWKTPGRGQTVWSRSDVQRDALHRGMKRAWRGRSVPRG